MDFSKFTVDDFDAKEWINDVFQSEEAQNNKEQFASTLVMKLQLLIQEVAKSLEDTSQQIVQTLPKLNREIMVMQQEASSLKNKMLSFERDVERVEHDTSNTMDSLLALDEAKNRMLEVEKALKEVDNWATLIKDVDDVFQSGNADLIADRLFNMQQSLKVLGRKVKDFQERHDFLERLKDQFTVAVSPSVVSALNSQNFDSAEYFSKMFARLERTADLEKYCHKIIKVEISKQWLNCVNNEDFTEPDALLNAFYDSLLSLWFDKLKRFSNVAKNPTLLLCHSIQKSLHSLDPSVESVLKTRLVSDWSSKNRLDSDWSTDQIGDQSMTALIRCKNAVDNIARSIESNLHGQQKALSSPENRSIIYGPRSLLAEFYRPFLFFLHNCQKYEQSYLLQRLNKLNLDKYGDLTSCNERLAKSVEIVFAKCSEALDRCRIFAHYSTLPFLLKSFERFFDNYYVLLFRTLEAIRQFTLSDRKYSEINHWGQFDNLFKLTNFSGNLALNTQQLKRTVDSITVTLKDKYLTGIDDMQDSDCSNKQNVNHFDVVILNDDVLKSALQQHLALACDSPESILSEITENLDKFLHQVEKLVHDLLLSPVKSILITVPKLASWSSANLGESLEENLPSFSLAPQEYIIKIGQYIMTFAHQLEPYMSQENAALKCFLNYLRQDPCDIETPEQVVRYWLKSMSEGVSKFYLESLLNIRELGNSGTKQLKADMNYLRDVLDDLGLEFGHDLLIFYRVLCNEDVESLETDEKNERDQKQRSKFVAVLKEMSRSRSK